MGVSEKVLNIWYDFRLFFFFLAPTFTLQPLIFAIHQILFQSVHGLQRDDLKACATYRAYLFLHLNRKSLVLYLSEHYKYLKDHPEKR